MSATSHSDVPRSNAFMVFAFTLLATSFTFWAASRVLSNSGAIDWDLSWRQSGALSALYTLHRIFWLTLTAPIDRRGSRQD